MRDFKNMKRQRGRNRGPGQGQGGGQGGGKPQQQNANRAFESNGPDNIKVRGHAQSVYEKYQQLSRDAFSSGDRVTAENHLQHAEHYFRLVRTLQPNRPPSDIVGRDIFTNGYDIDFEDESLEQAVQGEPAEAYQPEGPVEGSVDGRDARSGEFRRDRDERPREDRQDRGDRDRGYGRRDERPREDRFRDDRPRDDRSQTERSQADRPRDDRPQTDRVQNDRPREEGQVPAREGRRDRYDRDRPREGGYGERRDRFDRDRVEPGSDIVAEAEVVRPQPILMDTDDAPAPPREAQVEDAPRLRSEDGGFSPAPAFLQGAAPALSSAEADDGEQPKPRARRRRTPRSFEGGEEAAAPEAAPASEDA